MRIAVAAVFLAASAPALAAEPMTVSQCMFALQGLQALDAAGQTIGQPAPAGAKPYTFGALRWTIARDISALQSVSDAFGRARAELIREVGAGAEVKPGTPQYDDLLRRLQEVLDKPCDAQISRIPLAALRIGDDKDQNPIPPSVLAAIAPLVDQ